MIPIFFSGQCNNTDVYAWGHQETFPTETFAVAQLESHKHLILLLRDSVKVPNLPYD